MESLSIQIEEFCPVADEYEIKNPKVDSMLPEVILYHLQDEVILCYPITKPIVPVVICSEVSKVE